MREIEPREQSTEEEKHHSVLQNFLKFWGSNPGRLSQSLATETKEQLLETIGVFDTNQWMALSPYRKWLASHRTYGSGCHKGLHSACITGYRLS